MKMLKMLKTGIVTVVKTFNSGVKVVTAKVKIGMRKGA